MEEAATFSPSSSDPSPVGGGLCDLALLTLLVVLVVALRGWLLNHTEVVARDSIGYIRYALEFEHLSYGEVLRKNHQHPGYSLTILAVSWPVRALFGPADAFTMQLSAQLASNLASILLIFPMYFLGRALFDRHIGFWGTLLFQFLPVSGHLLSDGLSEALFLLLTTCSLLFAVQALRNPSSWRFVLCGLCCGLTYLTRPEGALLLASAGFGLVVAQWVPSWRRPWKPVLVHGTCLCLTACALGSLYFGFTHKFTNKPSAHLILGRDLVWESEPRVRPRQANPHALQASIWAAYFEKTGSFPSRLGKSLWAMGSEFVQGFHYAGAIPLLLGLWWYRGKFRTERGLWVVLTLCVLHGLTVLSLAISLAYVSDRHMMILVLCGCYAAAAGLRDLPARLIPRLEGLGRGTFLKAPILPQILLIALVVFGLPRTLQPLHGNRAGIHAAGLWLFRQVHSGDIVIDDHCWAHYYAGLVFQEAHFQIGPPPPPQPGFDPTCYVVINRSRDQEVGKNRQGEETKLQSAGGHIVYHWPADLSAQAARVVVYSLPKTQYRLVGGS